jgi:O-antigen/teichoic acid export membrane protein
MARYNGCSLSAADCDVSGSEKLPSLRSRFAWTFAGNGLYAASQWLVLSLIAKLGDAEMLGRYALAVAVVAPVAMLSHLNLRALIVTDMQGRHSSAEYLGVRLWTTGAGLAAIVLMALFYGRGRALTAAIVLIGLAQSAEAVSDLYYAFLQRRERMDRIAFSMIMRGFLSAAALAFVLWITRDLVAGVLALALARLAVLLLYDRRASSAPGRPLWHAGVFRSALPLGVVLMLGALNTNLPRYAIEWSAGARDLGIFAAVASFVTVGATTIHALGQAASPRLARAAGRRDTARFRALTLQVCGVAMLLGVAGVAVALVAGRFLLALIYRPEYAPYRDLLAGVMAASIAQYVAITLGYALTSARSFAAQIPLLSAAAGTTAVVSFVLTPRLGLAGAAVALAAAGCVQTAGAAWLLRGVLRRMEAAP